MAKKKIFVSKMGNGHFFARIEDYEDLYWPGDPEERRAIAQLLLLAKSKGQSGNKADYEIDRE